jgi:hypothetical protein
VAAFQDELAGFAETLEKFRKEITDGFVIGRLPLVDESAYDETPPRVGGTVQSSLDNPPFFVNVPSPGPQANIIEWDAFGRTFGAVDSHEGLGKVDRYPQDEFPNPGTATIPRRDDFLGVRHSAVAAFYPVFVIRHSLGSERRRLSLYVASGLDAVWACVQHLRKLAKERALSPVENFDRDNSWSLFRINTTLGSIFKDPTEPPTFGGPSMLDTIKRLAKCGGRPGLILPPQPQPQFLSWREALAPATP